MENLLLLLPDRPASIVLRYALTTLIVGICFLLQLGVELQSGFFGLFLLLPGIFIASLVFDRGSGFYATILSVALSVLILLRPGGGFGPLSQHLVPLVLFVLIGLGVATVSEALRNALEKAVRAERAKDLALHELNHRIRNDLAMAYTGEPQHAKSRNARSFASCRTRSCIAARRTHIGGGTHASALVRPAGNAPRSVSYFTFAR